MTKPVACFKRDSEGFKHALRSEASIFCNMPSSKVAGLNLDTGSDLKKSKCFAVTTAGERSSRSACSISYFDWFLNRDSYLYGFPDPGDAMLTNGAQHVREDAVEKPPSHTAQCK